MKKLLTAGFLFVWVLAAINGLFAQELLLEDFSNQAVGSAPLGWKARGGKPEEEYSVQLEEENRFLHAEANKKDVQLGLSVEQSDGGKGINPKVWPVLSWKWRAHEFPAGSDERKKKTQDSAAGVYVVFSGFPIPRTLKYIWSAVLPKGTSIPSPATSQTQMIVLESAPAKDANEWVLEKVNYYEDYKRLFGEEPDPPRGIAVLTDADATKSRAIADYDDFKLGKN